MKQCDKIYNEAIDLVNRFAESTDTNSEIYQELASRKDITHALALLQEHSGILRTDYKLAKLCADCFMLGVFVTSKSQGITMNEQEQAKKCLTCQYIDYGNGAFKCRLQKCKFE